jgi:hypothetical protein
MKSYLVCFAAFFIAGCNAGDQIEKCVQAGIDANGPYKSSLEKSEAEFAVRRMCLEAANGKKD